MSAREPSGRVHVRAPGKINLFLGVGDVQADGYHDLASVFQAVSLFEDLWAEEADDVTMTVDGTVDVSGVPTDDSNLAIRAAHLLRDYTGHIGGVRLSVRKSVPVAGGMGGGSADAAAALVACDALWGTNVAQSELHRLASRLGADVPFALHGGTAVGVGRGDQLSPALARGRFDWVLVLSDRGLSTPAVYGRVDEIRGRDVPDIAPPPTPPEVDPRVLHALRAGDPVMLAAALHNDMQQAALELRPDLAAALAAGHAAGAIAGIVSGSGPTVALLAAGERQALQLRSELAAAGHEVLHAHGPVPGARVVG